MAMKSNGNRTMSSGSSQLHHSTVINNARGLQALGNISRINPESAPSNSPFFSNHLQQPMSSSNPSFSGLPPPLPPKRSTYMPAYNRYSPMSNYFSPFSRYTPGYPGYRMPPYGAGYGMSPLTGSESYSSFTQMAEESTRPAFESIESVVEVVSSISMMLESTYHAVHSSYSAILGVVDQFSRLKDHFTQILSVLAILRWLRWMCLKILYLLGVRKENPSVEAAWDSAEKLVNGSNGLDMPDEVRSSAWPFFMFLGLVVGAPWLMFKLLAKSIAQRKPFDPRTFVDNNGRRYIAMAAYDFKATQAGELSFSAGERLMISPKSWNSNPKGGWYLACNEKQETGLVPSTYLKNIGRTVIRNVPMPQRMPMNPVENINIPSGAVSETETNNMPQRMPINPVENINIPSGAVSETETNNTADDFVKSPENPNNELVDKSADSPDLAEVVVEKSAEPPVIHPGSKSDTHIDSE
ncbi:Peroxisomal membrane protein PEX13 like protein [Argiope bruennichi]|uniref:Peroxisomal membrane protein PEX13 n=1 Tax=Argiope bruennichi TaxID=94029 RepID=A0A8T0EVZ7_ARGBR|nr:Peroxisomal membrane protein PEX13 like protein [Argiope bruennichi]